MNYYDELQLSIAQVESAIDKMDISPTKLALRAMFILVLLISNRVNDTHNKIELEAMRKTINAVKEKYND